MKTETINNLLIDELASNATVRHGSGYCEWIISGHFTDSDGDRREVKAITQDEELAMGWYDNLEDVGIYEEYRRRWAEFLVDTLELVNLY